MEITDEMLQAAVRKAVEAGLLPRNACRDDVIASKEIMRPIVQAILAANPHETCRSGTPSLVHSRANSSFPTRQDVKHAISTYAYG
jgi:hypothetical protein